MILRTTLKFDKFDISFAFSFRLPSKFDIFLLEVWFYKKGIEKIWGCSRKFAQMASPSSCGGLTSHFYNVIFFMTPLPVENERVGGKK